ncbi:hypothetical protein OV208_06135 [Corallococcus sp. bb12-1]|uniref:hypothetical protein n=1 Tax=Corallococcus sp. bb12-1 TaxID=2996784 RepID=UPI0022711C72|nr:hypothetical protein [Corallococcus sp. bb12-1]MCY1040897.1 hypothetical protein [Corallococcus sp. bb12-1]
MKSGLFLPVCLVLSGCALFHRGSRPVHAPPEEAARIQFPLDLPEDAQTLAGSMVTAMQLALDDFRPLDLKPHKGATEEELCLYQRESYDVTAAAGPEGVTFVQITLKPQLCEKQGPIMDMGATYAVDVKGRRILAIQH